MAQTIDNFVLKLRNSKNSEEILDIRLELVKYLSDLSEQYSSRLREFSSSVINNKEEWFKKSMTECIHQAGREVGYEHERVRVEIEAVKSLIQTICDIDKVDQLSQGDHPSGPVTTVPSSTSELGDEPGEE